jgi:hypothetical protein
MATKTVKTQTRRPKHVPLRTCISCRETKQNASCCASCAHPTDTFSSTPAVRNLDEALTFAPGFHAGKRP